MKKKLSLLIVLMLIVFIISACGSESKKTSNTNEGKDVSMLLKGIGGELAIIQSLGELPQPQVSGQLYYYDTKGIEGYFEGYNLGVEIADDQKTVTRIYIQPYDNYAIQVNGFTIGCDVADANALFGKGELNSVEQDGKIHTYMTYKDSSYAIKCTVENNLITAVSFTALKIEAEAAERDETTEPTDDEVITTYAYQNIDGIDVSSLQEVEFNALDATSGYGTSGDTCEYKAAFFGKVNNVQINYSTYTYEDSGKEIAHYDHLENTLLTIKSNEFIDSNGLFVWFEDGRGTRNMFLYGDEMVATNGKKVELVSGFTALEKTPSSYTAYDMSDIMDCFGMTTDEFEGTSLMQNADKEIMPGMDYEYYEYTLKDYIKGYEIHYQASEDDHIVRCIVYKNEETYDQLSDEEKYSFQGMDFDMSVIRARHNLVEPDSSIELSIWGDTEEGPVSSLTFSKE